MSESELVSDLRLTANVDSHVGSQGYSHDSLSAITLVAVPVPQGSGQANTSMPANSMPANNLSLVVSPVLASPVDGSQSYESQAQIRSPSDGERTIVLPTDEAAMEFFTDEAEARHYIRHLLERVHNLERALDQTVASYTELRAKMQDQVFLERQLAATEEYSHLQQHEIERLRRQLVEQQPKQVPLLEEKLRLAWDRVASLEAQLEETRQQIARLCEQLNDQQTKLARSMTQRDSSHQGLPDESGLTPNYQPPVGSSTIASLLQELLKAQARIKTLETHTTEQLRHQELMQRAYQDLEAEHLTLRGSIADYNPEHTRKLERQVGEMQEQILMQEKQAEEYETAIHHWKDRYTTSQQQACQLKELLRQQLPNLPPDSIPTELLALLDAIQPANAEELSQPVSPTLKSNKLKRKPKVDLPEFLTRQRSGSQAKP